MLEESLEIANAENKKALEENKKALEVANAEMQAILKKMRVLNKIEKPAIEKRYHKGIEREK